MEQFTWWYSEFLCFKTKYDKFMGFNKYITHEIY